MSENLLKSRETKSRQNPTIHNDNKNQETQRLQTHLYGHTANPFRK